MQLIFNGLKDTDPDHTPPLEPCDLGLHLAMTFLSQYLGCMGTPPLAIFSKGNNF